MASVMATQNTMTPKNIAAASADRPGPAASPRKNRPIRAISVGKRPLHGTKQLVRMATSRSLGLAMMRQPVTPQALQPKPMAMVRLCRPQAPAARKHRSMQKATLGRYPASSSSVNRGKKMAMGGSITATTHATVR